MIDGAPKRPPGARSETLTWRRLPLAREIHATRPVPSEASAMLGRNATASVWIVRGAPRDGPSADPKATATRLRVVANPEVKMSAPTERCAYGITRRVSLGSVRSPPNAPAPGASEAPRTPFVRPVPTPSWKPQSATTVPLPLDPASRPDTNVCGVEIVAGAVHVAAEAGPAASRTAADAAVAIRGRRMTGERMRRPEGCGPPDNSGGPSMRVPPLAGLTSRHVGRRRSSFDRRRLAGGEPPTSRPGALLGGASRIAGGDACQLQASIDVSIVTRSDAQVGVLGLDQRLVARVDRLRDRDERESRLDVAARLDPAPRDRHRDVLLALEVAVRRLRGHRHADLRLPGDVVGPLPVEVAVLAALGRADVHDHVDVVELEALRDVGVAQLRPHLGVLVHHREDLVDDLAELLRRGELGAHGQLAFGFGFGLVVRAGRATAVPRAATRHSRARRSSRSPRMS